MYLEVILPGSTLHVGIQGVTVALTSEYVGMLKDECLIITSPTPFMQINRLNKNYSLETELS